VHCANVITPSNNPKADMGYIILEATECPAMSGSNTICVATVLLETGILPMTEPVTELTLEAPGGLIGVRCDCRDGKVTGVTFTNQPAFVYHLDAHVEVPGHGTITLDVAYGGMTYALVDAASLGFALTPDEAHELCALGELVKDAADAQLDAVHPENPKICGITQTEFMGPIEHDGDMLRARNAVVVKPGRIDRSPCGTGTSARLALMHRRGLIREGQTLDHLSLIGTHFYGTVAATCMLGDKPAVVPTVKGQAWIAGIGQYGLDPTDPFPAGYTLSDTWMQAL
jgi:proline racemase